MNKPATKADVFFMGNLACAAATVGTPAALGFSGLAAAILIASWLRPRQGGKS